MMRKICLLAAAAILLPATAQASVKFKVTGGGPLDSYSFAIDGAFAPNAFSAHSFSVTDVASQGDIGFGVTDYLADYNFYDTTQGGGFDGGYAINVYPGAQLFTGLTSAPRFQNGTYALVDYYGQATTLTINGVPEPTSWALMIVGLGMSGASLRRRRARKISLHIA